MEGEEYFPRQEERPARVREKDQQREELARLTAEYLARGGKIEHVPSGILTRLQEHDARRGRKMTKEEVQVAWGARKEASFSLRHGQKKGPSK